MNKIYLLLFSMILSCSNVAPVKKSALSKYDFKNPNAFPITSKLNEISGLTTTSDGKLFAINDEVGTIYKIDPNSGQIIKRFFLGKWLAEADFEGIAFAGKYIYAITSKGNLYKFLEGENEKSVEYEIIKLRFSSKFNLEGLYYDADLNGLLIVPKEYSGKKYKDYRTIFYYSLSENQIKTEPLIKISLDKLKDNFNIKDFYPSGITKHSESGNYLIVSAKGDNVIVEIDSIGNIIDVQKLKEKDHRQPEGITILNDLTLVISDESAGKKPTITKYHYKGGENNE